MTTPAALLTQHESLTARMMAAPVGPERSSLYQQAQEAYTAAVLAGHPCDTCQTECDSAVPGAFIMDENTVSRCDTCQRFPGDLDAARAVAAAVQAAHPDVTVEVRYHDHRDFTADEPIDGDSTYRTAPDEGTDAADAALIASDTDPWIVVNGEQSDLKVLLGRDNDDGETGTGNSTFQGVDGDRRRLLYVALPVNVRDDEGLGSTVADCLDDALRSVERDSDPDDPFHLVRDVTVYESLGALVADVRDAGLPTGPVPVTYEQAARAYGAAASAMSAAARTELIRRVREQYPAAETFAIHGEYADEGDLRVHLSGMLLPDDALDLDDDALDAFDDELIEVFGYLAGTSGEDYVGTEQIDLTGRGIDESSSASRQHYIDTGLYLPNPA